jgi:parallel beta-helix repeat protein
MLAAGVVAALLPQMARGAEPVRTLVHCDQTVSSSIRLDNNLTCSGRGLLLDTSGVTVDLNGHHITRSPAGASIGIEIANGVSDVVVRNGVVRGFDSGVVVPGSNNQVDHLLLVGNLHAISTGGPGHRILKNRIVRGVGSDNTGISLFGPETKKNTVADNEILGTNFGINVRGEAKNNLIERNVLTAVKLQGILVQDSSKNKVRENRLDAANGINVGVADGVAEDNEVSRNVVRHATNGIDLGGTSGSAPGGPARTSVLANTVEDNDLAGIHVATGTETLVKGNRVRRNGMHGVESATSSLEVSDNVLNANGYEDGEAVPDQTGLGLEAPVGVTGSGNTAKGNDDPDGCEPALCTVTVAPLPPDVTLAECGKDITTDIKLGNSLYCSGDALDVLADGVTIDLNGHHLFGSGTGAGIDNGAGNQNVTVKNGVITGFANGIDHRPGASGDPDGAVVDSVLVGGVGTGLFLWDGDGAKVLDSRIVDANQTGLYFLQAAGAKVKRTQVTGTGGSGASFDTSSTSASVVDSTVTGAGLTGIRFSQDFGSPSGGGSVIRTAVKASGGEGIYYATDELSGGSPIRIEDNIIATSGLDGLSIDGDQTGVFNVEGNISKRNSRYGYLVSGGVFVDLIANKAIDNGFDGMKADVAGPVFSENVANHNGFADSNPAPDTFGYGISALNGAQKPNNSAANNDVVPGDPQCNPASLCP